MKLSKLLIEKIKQLDKKPIKKRHFYTVYDDNYVVMVSISSRKEYRQSIRKACNKIFKRRREAGRCTQCNKKVTDYNITTKKPYIKCTKHRLRDNELCRLKNLQTKI